MGKREKDKQAVKEILESGCNCDLLYGYRCGIHTILERIYPDIYDEAYREWFRGDK